MTDEDSIRAAVLDHVDSWFDGDATRMERTLHPHYSALETFTAQDLIKMTAEGQGCREDTDQRQISIEISHLGGDVARVVCESQRYLEVHQLVRTPEGWKILNGIWQSPTGSAELLSPLLAGPSGEPHCTDGPPSTPTLRNPCEGRTQPRRPGPGGRRGRRRR